MMIAFDLYSLLVFKQFFFFTEKQWEIERANVFAFMCVFVRTVLLPNIGNGTLSIIFSFNSSMKSAMFISLLYINICAKFAKFFF